MSASAQNSSLARKVAVVRSDELRGLAEKLGLEFEAPVGLLDPTAGAWRVCLGHSPEVFPAALEVLAALVDPDTGRAVVDQVRVFHAGAERSTRWLCLPLPLLFGPNRLCAIVGFAAQDNSGPTPALGPACPERALKAWGRHVAERLRRAAEGLHCAEIASDRGSSPAEGREKGSARQSSRALALLEQLTTGLCVSDPPERFQRMAAGALRQALRVAAVAWVPNHPREPVIVAGGVEGLSTEAFRALLPEDRSQTVRIVNPQGGPNDGSRRRFVVVAANTEDASGWFVAVNPLDNRSFTPSEVELIHPVALLVGTHRTNARHYADLKELLFGVIRALTSAIDAKDPYTSGHSERVARIAVRLAEELGVPPHDRGDLYLMGLLHDVGKIGIEDDVLKKNGPLTAEEFRVIQSHVRIGVQILSDLKKLHHLLPGVAHHHESVDGTGYPTGLAGENIPLAARILAVADAFDAMSSTRPYRRRLSTEQIDDVLRKGAGKQWDERVVSAVFACRPDLEHIRSKGLGESLNRVVTDTLGRRSLEV